MLGDGEMFDMMEDDVRLVEGNMCLVIDDGFSGDVDFDIGDDVGVAEKEKKRGVLALYRKQFSKALCFGLIILLNDLLVYLLVNHRNRM